MHEQHSGAVSTSGEVLDRGVFPSSRAPLTSTRRWRSNVHGDLEPKPWNLDPCEGWETSQKTCGCLLPRADDFSPFSIEVGEQGPAAAGLENLLKRPLKQLTSTCWSCLLFCKIPCNFSVGIALCTLLLLEELRVHPCGRRLGSVSPRAREAGPKRQQNRGVTPIMQKSCSEPSGLCAGVRGCS
jgi:hypothetical protein